MLIFYSFYILNLDFKSNFKILDFEFNQIHVNILEYIFICFSIISLIMWLKKWMYQYNIRSEWIITLWKIIEEKHCLGYRKYYKYKIEFLDTNSKMIVFEEIHTSLLESKKQMYDNWIEWLEWTNICPKVEIIYDKFDSLKAIIK
jgi:hypothetical protein